MRCPTCGHLNNDLATRCSACGAPLPSTKEPPTAEMERVDKATSEHKTAGPAASNAAEANATEANVAASDATASDATAPRKGRIRKENPPAPSSAKPRGTEARAQAVADSPRATVHRRGLRKLLGLAATHTSQAGHRAGTALHRHGRAVGIGVALCVVGAIAAVWVFSILVDAPAYELVEADISSALPTYEYDGGAYGHNASLALSGIAVTDRQRTRTPKTDGSASSGRRYTVDAEAVYEADDLRVVREVRATYARDDGEWVMTGGLEELSTQVVPRSGVDEEKVLAGVGAILEAATPAGASSLLDIYADGSFAIAENTFFGHGGGAGGTGGAGAAEATNDVVIHCARDAGFYTYDGNVTAHFGFVNGAWRLQSADAESGVDQRHYSPLVGTWSGTLVAHEADGGSCYGAKSHPLEITIASVEDAPGGGGRMEGSVLGIAHLHGRLENDASTNVGDVLLEGATFEGVISPEYDATTGSNLNVSCDVSADELASATNGAEVADEPGTADAADAADSTGTSDGGAGNDNATVIGAVHDFGWTSVPTPSDTPPAQNVTEVSVSMQLSFGTDEDPSLVMARVTTTYRYEELLLMLFPHQTTARFTDTYVLTRMA